MRNLRSGILVMVVLGIAISAIAHASESAPIRSAVKYREWPLGGDQKDTGRVLASKGSTYYGIDINSRVAIEIDEPALAVAAALLPSSDGLDPEIANLTRRLAALADGMKRVGPAYDLAINTINAHYLWKTEEERNRVDPQRDRNQEKALQDSFTDLAGQMGQELLVVFNALKVSIQNRLIDQGYSSQDAARRADKECMPIVDPTRSLDGGYDWEYMRSLFRAEIEFIDGRLEAIAFRLGFQIEVQAHLIKNKEGAAAVALPLPGHNDVVGDVASMYRKIRFDAPPDQLELAKYYQKAEKNAEETNNILNALLIQLKIDVERRSDQIEQLLAEIRAIAGEIESGFSDLNSWTESDRIETWLGKMRTDLASNQEVQDLLDELEPFFKEFEADLKALVAYAELANEMAGLSPEQFVARLREEAETLAADYKRLGVASKVPGLRALMPETWRKRAAELQKLEASIKGASDAVETALLDPEGPVGSLLALGKTVQSIPDRISAKSGKALDGLFGLRAYSVLPPEGKYPRPKGQRRLGLEFGKDLDTAFDLKTAPGGRQPGDQVVVTIALYRGSDAELIRWRDQFHVTVFGWQDATLAGLAFVQASGSDRWQPAATFSWYLDYRNWPDEDDLGLDDLQGMDLFGGFGVTGVSLDFDSEKDVELGAAISVSLINRLLQAGYGWNLQDHGQPFYYFSMKLFGTSGFLSQ